MNVCKSAGSASYVSQTKTKKSAQTCKKFTKKWVNKKVQNLRSWVKQ